MNNTKHAWKPNELRGSMNPIEDLLWGPWGVEQREELYVEDDEYTEDSDHETV